MCSVLNIEVIGDIVGSFLPLRDLESCRQVSKSWYEWASPPFHKKSILVLRNLNDFKKLKQHPDINYLYHPHKRVAFKFVLMEGSKFTSSLNSFWMTHGAGLTYLRLENVEKCETTILEEILIGKNTPKLKTLVLSNCFIHGGSDLKKIITNSYRPQTNLTELEIGSFFRCLDSPFRWKILVFLAKLFPNIKVFRLNSYFLYLDLPYHFLAKALWEMDKCNSLKELDILKMNSKDEVENYTRIPIHFIYVLQNHRFPLETLKICFGLTDQANTVQQILKIFKDTLQQLVIFRPGNVLTYFEPFQSQMEKLKVLRMSDNMSSTIKFLEFTSNLEILELCSSPDKENFLQPRKRLQGGRATELKPNIIERTPAIYLKNCDIAHLREIRFNYENYSKEMKQKLSFWMPKAEKKCG